MRIYLAGGSSEIDICAGWMDRLRAAGYEITHDWVETIRRSGDANPREASHPDRYRWSYEDLEGVCRADLVWLLIPERPSIGLWVEAGYALGRRAPIIVSGDWRKSIFTALALRRYDTHEEAFSWLTS